jgi:hypothetical protein
VHRPEGRRSDQRGVAPRHPLDPRGPQDAPAPPPDRRRRGGAQRGRPPPQAAGRGVQVRRLARHHAAVLADVADANVITHDHRAVGFLRLGGRRGSQPCRGCEQRGHDQRASVEPKRSWDRSSSRRFTYRLTSAHSLPAVSPGCPPDFMRASRRPTSRSTGARPSARPRRSSRCRRRPTPTAPRP